LKLIHPVLLSQFFGEGVIESVITGNTLGNDYVYIIEEAQYSHICFFIRIELNVITDVENPNQSDIPLDFALNQNYPNPFNPTTRIQYQLSGNSQVTLKVYNILGSEVATLVNEEKQAGSYEVSFDASDLSSGIYFYSLRAGSFIETKKMLLLK
jgi:hypothetical protein